MIVSTFVWFINPKLIVVTEYFVVSVSKIREPLFNFLYHWINGAGYAKAEQMNVALSSASTVVSSGPFRMCASAAEEIYHSLVTYMQKLTQYLDKILQLVDCQSTEWICCKSNPIDQSHCPHIELLQFG